MFPTKMLIPTLIMGTLAGILLMMGYFKGGGQHISGLKFGLNMMVQIFPLLIFALVVAGMIQILLPAELISKWIGVESGWKGIMIGSAVGGFTPGGPFVSMPIAASLLHSGASVGSMVAYMTAWSIWSVNRLPMEVGIMGWKFTMIRLASSLVLPPLAGLIAQFFFQGKYNV